MKTMLRVLVKTIVIFASLAAARALHADPEVTVWARHPDAVRKFFPADKYRMLDAEDERKQMDETGYIAPEERDALFHKLGIEAKLTPLDEMDKDMLVMTARFEDARAVKKHYPMLSETQANDLVREVKESRVK